MSAPLRTPYRKSSLVYVVFSLTAVLLLSGLLVLALLHARGWANSLPGGAILLVELRDGAPSAEVRELVERLRTDPALRPETVQYLSKEEAARRLSEEDGMGDFVAELGFNPLSNSVQGNFRADASAGPQVDSIVAALGELPIVKEAFCDRSGELVFEGISSRATWTLAGLAALFAVIAVSLMDSAMRLALYADRFLVRNMQLVGATREFIVGPYRLMGLRSGLLGGVLASAGLLLIEWLLRRSLPEVIGATEWAVIAPVLVLLPVVGALLAGLSAALAVNKYVGKSLDELV